MKYMKKKVIKKKASGFRCMSCDKLCGTKEKWRTVLNVNSAVCGPCAKLIDSNPPHRKTISFPPMEYLAAAHACATYLEKSPTPSRATGIDLHNSILDFIKRATPELFK